MSVALRSAEHARFNEMKGFVLAAGGLFLLVSLFTFHPDDLAFFSSNPSVRTHNLCGVVGAYLSSGIRTLLGLAGYLIPLLIFIWATAAFLGRKSSKRYAQLIGFIGFCVAAGAFLSILWVQEPSARVYRGGLIGLGVGDWLLHYCGFVGAVIVVSGIGALSFLLATDMLLVPILTVLGVSSWKTVQQGWARLRGTAQSVSAPRSTRVQVKTRPAISKSTTVSEPPPVRLSVDRPEQAARETAAEPQVILAPKPKVAAPKPPAKKVERPSTPGNYQLPPLDLLNVPPAPEARQLKEDLQLSAQILKDTLMDFGIEVNVAQVEQGPTITRYELEPAPGVKVTKITGLSDDIALAMKAPSVRIIAPIPGKARIGIEVPNTSATKVYLREVLESEAYRSNTSKIALAFGKDTAGYPLVADLAAMPHLLIAGTTGSGKTVCVNGLITALLINATPDEVKFLMVDPKMVEMAVYNGLPHLLAPVQTDPKKVPKALNWVVMEMENRYKLFARLGVRNIQTYHQKFKAKEFPQEEAPPVLPYLMVIIDELADLMLVARTEIETSIARLAQLSRAVGIHMVLATQRPSVDVLTGVIKANFPARISFQVASKVDARTVLDGVGAEKLLGHGDMLFMKPGAAKLIRAQACLVTDQEIERVVGFIKQQGLGSYDESLFDEAVKSPGDILDDKDLMYDEAVQVIVNAGQASVSLLQRRLRLGYGRAARILDMMEQEGIVGPIRGAKPREVLIKSYKGSAPAGASQQDLPATEDEVSNADDR